MFFLNIIDFDEKVIKFLESKITGKNNEMEKLIIYFFRKGRGLLYEGLLAIKKIFSENSECKALPRDRTCKNCR